MNFSASMIAQIIRRRTVMKRNVGGKDQTVRFMIASAGVATGLFAKRGWIKALGFSIGGAELASAITRYSPLNECLHRNTAA
jgi:Protein of unknown function (DUF2892)